MKDDSLVALLGWVEDEKGKFLEEMTESKVREEVRGTLDKRTKDLMARVLGMSNTWGRWEIDHCNGRKSPLSNRVEVAIENEVNKWLADHVQDVQEIIEKYLPGMIQKEVRQNLGYKVRTIVGQELDKAILAGVHDLLQDKPLEVAAKIMQANKEARKRKRT